MTRARVYSEDLYIAVDHWLQRLLRTIARRERRPAGLLAKMFQDELKTYLLADILPADGQLAGRREGTGLYFSSGRREFLTRRQVQTFERLVANHYRSADGRITGQCAMPGTARGRVRIVFDPMRAKDFKRGEIMVTIMTRPEFLPLMKLAGAIVTDAGGVLSHAAIVSRELKVPCVIGTQVASRILRNGDIVEVDATHGIVRIIKRM